MKRYRLKVDVVVDDGITRDMVMSLVASHLKAFGSGVVVSLMQERMVKSDAGSGLNMAKGDEPVRTRLHEKADLLHTRA